MTDDRAKLVDVFDWTVSKLMNAVAKHSELADGPVFDALYAISNWIGAGAPWMDMAGSDEEGVKSMSLWTMVNHYLTSYETAETEAAKGLIGDRQKLAAAVHHTIVAAKQYADGAAFLDDVAIGLGTAHRLMKEVGAI